MTTRQYQVGPIKSMFDELIDRHAQAYQSAFPEIKEFSPFEKSGTLKYYIGMVWTNDHEKPDDRQLKIRTSESLGNNKLVDLDLSAIEDQQSFFPGQIIAFLADPFQGRRLTVRKIMDSLKIAPPMKKIDLVDPIKLVINAGPFMSPDVEDWSLLEKTIDAVKSHEATHVVLLGPFVDMENREIRNHYDNAWKTVLDKLHEGLHEHSCQVYLVPSNRDILPSSLATNCFYPCSKMELPSKNIRKDVKLSCKIQSVTDPCQLDLGGVYLDVTSAEILFHLNKCILFKNKSAGSPFNSIFRHLITYGIYPLYPGPTDIAIDHVKLHKYNQLDRLGPHIILLPTRFNAPATNVENRLIVPVQKCSVKKQAVFIEIPKIDGSMEIDSVLIGGCTNKTIELCPKKEEIQPSETIEEPSQAE